MAGFKLIEEYLSSSESEDNDDNDKTFHSENITNSVLSSNLNEPRKINSDVAKPLPLPLSIFTKKKLERDAEQSKIDDTMQSDLHDGRIRSFKHERGNWATLVYIEYKPLDSLQRWMELALAELPVKGKLIIGHECHISLSRTLIFKFHWIDSFAESLRKICQNTGKFTLEMMDIKIYCNEEKTRTFLGIECQSLDSSFQNLQQSIDKLLQNYQQPTFYENASYHVSFLWTLGDTRAQLESLVPSLRESLQETLTRDIVNSYIKVSEIHCKIGNKIYKCPLR